MTINPIGIIHSPFTERFGIPRQAGLVASATGSIELLAPYNVPETVRGLEDVSHIWVSFVFHDVPEGEWRPTVRPPRLGGNTRVGVFASRSPYRPNRLGLSVFKLDAVETDNGVRLKVSGLDCLDGTPVVDIKPYLPYCEAIPAAQAGFAQVAPANALTVVFSDEVELAFQARKIPSHQRQLIIEVLSQDIRPAYHDDEHRVYGVTLAGLNIKWRVNGDRVTVINIEEHK